MKVLLGLLQGLVNRSNLVFKENQAGQSYICLVAGDLMGSGSQVCSLSPRWGLEPAENDTGGSWDRRALVSIWD